MSARRFPAPCRQALAAMAVVFVAGAWGQGALPGAPRAGASGGASTTAGSNTPSASTAARFIESCQQALDQGRAQAGCQGTLYPAEVNRLKEEALRTKNPQLLTLLGDAYQNNRTGQSDIGQAYRWYVLAAVRGDPRAMQRLSQLYRAGTGSPDDKVKALGYARLAQRLAVPGSKMAGEAAQAVRKLGADMASEEMVLADGFADELEKGIQRKPIGSSASTEDTTVAPPMSPASPVGIPGLAGAQPAPPLTPAPPGRLPDGSLGTSDAELQH